MRGPRPGRGHHSKGLAEKGMGLICDGTGEGLVAAECSLAQPEQATEMDVET